MAIDSAAYTHVRYSWDDAVAEKLDPVARLVYRSNLLGADQRITNTGGGNTSSKLQDTDPLTGEQVQVLWVKGSGGDLRTSKRDNFASLYLDKLRALQLHYHHAPLRGPKSPIEDAIVARSVQELQTTARQLARPAHDSDIMAAREIMAQLDQLSPGRDERNCVRCPSVRHGTSSRETRSPRRTAWITSMSAG